MAGTPGTTTAGTAGTDGTPTAGTDSTDGTPGTITTGTRGTVVGHSVLGNLGCTGLPKMCIYKC